MNGGADDVTFLRAGLEHVVAEKVRREIHRWKIFRRLHQVLLFRISHVINKCIPLQETIAIMLACRKWDPTNQARYIDTCLLFFQSFELRNLLLAQRTTIPMRTSKNIISKIREAKMFVRWFGNTFKVVGCWMWKIRLVGSTGRLTTAQGKTRIVWSFIFFVSHRSYILLEIRSDISRQRPHKEHLLPDIQSTETRV